MLFESREQKAERLYSLISSGNKVSRWEVMPVRDLLLKIAKEKSNPEPLEEIKFLIDEAKSSL